jgi:hypothetical protein
MNDDDLVRRIETLESRVSTSGGIRSDLRVIEMQIARAEEKVLRLSKNSCWTQPAIPLRLTEN